MKTIKSLTFAALAALAVTLPASATDEANHEVWMIDQSNTYDSDANGTLDSGGTLYIYDGKDLAASPRCHLESGQHGRGAGGPAWHPGENSTSAGHDQRISS